jgi:predicted dehydrogenase
LNDNTLELSCGVGILGPESFVATQQGIVESLSTVSVAGRWKGMSSSRRDGCSDSSIHAAEGLIDSPAVAVVVVGAPLRERLYWCQRALDAGKVVMCQAPLGDRLEDIERMGRVMETCAGRLQLVEPARGGRISTELAGAASRLGHVVYFELEVYVSGSRSADAPAGVLLGPGISYLSLLKEAIAPVDTVWAETRNLQLSGIAEDVATAYLRCLDGSEGVIRYNALGAVDRARLALYSRAGDVELVDSTANDEAAAWSAAYDALGTRAAAQPGQIENLTALVSAQRLVRWIQQSARARRELTRKEASVG